MGRAESMAENVLGRGAMKVTALWKLSKVALNPPTQARNFMSNGVLLHLSGVNRPVHRVRQAIKEMRKGGKHWDIAKKYGVTQSTFANQELIRLERELLNIQPGKQNPLGGLKEMAGKVGNFAGDTYQLSESIFKTAKIIDEMAKGATEADAALEAQKWLFDYSLVPASVDYLRKASVGVPFLTFYYKAFPRLIETAVKSPHRYLPYVIAPEAMGKWIEAEYDVTRDDVERLKKSMPTWLQRQGSAYILPYKDKNGQWQAANVGYFFPWSMFTQVGGELAEGEFGEAVQSAGALGGPIPDLIAAIKTNKDPFTGKPILDPAASPSAQVGQLVNYMWSLAAPSWVTERGAAMKIYEAMFEDVDEYGRPTPTAMQAALRLAGINIYPFDPSESRRFNVLKMQRELDDIKRHINRAMRNKQLTPAQRSSVREQGRKRLKAKRDEISKYMKESRVPKELR